jgi:hypothetical protein
MPRYAPLPVHDNEDQELNRAFNVEDDEDENAPDHTPLLARGQPSPGQARTPQTASHQRTIDGRYNFEYDFPPPGSPPRELAGPNHWGNSNGVVVPGPVQYDPNSNRRNWISRTWATLTGRAGRETQPVGHSIGGGTSNDGVFFNLSSRPTRPTITEPPAATSQTPPVDPESIFHAPEIAREDAPPSYYAAQADVAPAYTVLATAPDDFTIDSLPAGSIIGFLWVSHDSHSHSHAHIVLQAFTVSVFLEWIGFVLAYMLTSSHAGRCGAKAGLGISFVRLGLWFRNRADNNPSGNDGPEGLWWGALDGLNTTSHVSPYIPSSFNSTGYKHLHFSYNSTTPDPHSSMKGLSSFPLVQWVAIFLVRHQYSH